MARFRVLMGHKVPTDHLIDVENVPASFLKNLELQSKQNWINKDKPEYMVEYKANQWEDLQAMIKKFSKDARTAEPACIVKTDDMDRARILPPNLKDEDVPMIVLALDAEKAEEVVPAEPSFVCPNCPFEGKTQADIEGHLQEKHGEDPSVRSFSGQSVGSKKAGEETQARETVYACFQCDFQTPERSAFMAHGADHIQNTISPVTSCGIAGCTFKTDDNGKMRGHRVGAHRKQKAALGA